MIFEHRWRRKKKGDMSVLAFLFSLPLHISFMYVLWLFMCTLVLARYKSSLDTLKSLKLEVEHLQHLLQVAKVGDWSASLPLLFLLVILCLASPLLCSIYFCLSFLSRLCFHFVFRRLFFFISLIYITVHIHTHTIALSLSLSPSR